MSPEIQFYLDCKSDGIGHAQWAYDVWVLLKFSRYLYHQIAVKWKQKREHDDDDEIEWVAMVSHSLCLVCKHRTIIVAAPLHAQKHLNTLQNNNNISSKPSPMLMSFANHSRFGRTEWKYIYERIPEKRKWYGWCDRKKMK